MGEQNRKNTKSEKSPGNVSKSAVKKADKEKMKELAQKKKELEEELDELRGNTIKGKLACILVLLLLIGLWTGLFVSMVKLDAGGVASTLLAPLIGDVPIARSILPAEMQKKSPSELAAEEAQAEAERAAAQAQAEAEAQAAAQAEEQAQAEAQVQAEAAQAEVKAAQVAEKIQVEEKQAQAEAEEAAALQDYVDTYSAMKPQDAAKLFESMIPDQEEVVIRILKNLTPEGRAAILSNMDVTNAAELTEKMRQ